MKYLSFFTFLVLISCGAPAEPAENKMTAPQPGDKPQPTTAEMPVKLDTITGVPPEIIGCNCVYAADSVSLATEKYLYLASYGKTNPADEVGLIATKGQRIQFNPNTPETNGYTIELKPDDPTPPSTEESMQRRQATLTVKFPSGEILKKRVIGICGC